MLLIVVVRQESGSYGSVTGKYGKYLLTTFSVTTGQDWTASKEFLMSHQYNNYMLQSYSIDIFLYTVKYSTNSKMDIIV